MFCPFMFVSITLPLCEKNRHCLSQSAGRRREGSIHLIKFFHRDQSTTAGVAKFFTSGFCYQKNNKQNFFETTDFPKFL